MNDTVQRVYLQNDRKCISRKRKNHYRQATIGFHLLTTPIGSYKVNCYKCQAARTEGEAAGSNTCDSTENSKVMTSTKWEDEDE